MHPLHIFKYCPCCGAPAFAENDERSKRCTQCGFVFYHNASAATVAVILNAKGQLLVARRAMEPARGTLDLPGGFVDPGESIDEGCRREVREEIGLEGFTPEKICHYLYDSDREREMVYVYRATWDGEVHPSDETDGGRFWSIDELRANLGKGVLTPNFEMEAVKVGLL